MIFRVHVKPNAKSDSVAIKENDELHIRISASPVDGKANKYLVNYLSEILKVPQSSVVILKGLNSPHKTIEIIAGDEYIKSVLKNYR
jgi:uncharacterized protein